MPESMDRPLRVLLVDDEEIVHQTIGDYLRHAGHSVKGVHSAEEALHEAESGDWDLALLDIRLPGVSGISVLERLQALQPDLSVVMISGHGTMDTVIDVLRRGAVDYLKKPLRLEELDAILAKADRMHTMRRRQRHMAQTIRDLQGPLITPPLVGLSPATERTREEIRRAVEGDCNTVLLTGETGTGKEVVAHQIHRQAAGKHGPFVTVCCPALSETLAESELFGHVRGAFTGAVGPKPGYFELADGGTIFLDEVADLSLTLQAKMLRVLESRTLRRVGGTRELHVDIRIIAASNVRLEELVESGAFRRDLFYRLNVYRIHLLPLDERPEDIAPLAEHFLKSCLTSRPSEVEGFAEETLEVLRSHHYPGNARELRNIVERAAIICRSGLIQPEHLAFAETHRSAALSPGGGEGDGEIERIREALVRAKWNRRQAAEDLGMPYSTLRYKMDKLGIT
ncbi:sigma-54-dependent Fis family transcriptional regulator [Candidatus Sumerlaeota bacterium]|nr:sigma-54-dependent Fis family transcriptional regulator [Candidatus Sumerlaeota bacterium]